MAAGSTQISDARRVDGSVDVEGLARILLVTPNELAASAGLSQSNISGEGGHLPHETDTRIYELLEILEQVEPWTGSAQAAFTWYKSQPLPSFEDLTAQDLVKAGRSVDVKLYLSRIRDGGYT